MPPQAGGPPVQVVQPYYKIVKGLPAAVVRSYKEPLYDSELILAATPSAELVLFQKPIGQTLADNATRKTTLHTNQTTAGQLGTPLSFDVYGYNLRLTEVNDKSVLKANFDLIFARAVVTVQFGQDTTFLTVPAEDIPSGVDVEGLGTTDSPHIGWGSTDNLYRFDIGGRALHINSTESYSVKITFPTALAGITGNHLIRFYMRGIKYKGI